MSFYKYVVTTDDINLTARDYIYTHAKSVEANMWFDECTEVLWDLYNAENGTRCYITDAVCPDAVLRLGRLHGIPLVVIQSPEELNLMDAALLYRPECNSQVWEVALIERTVLAAQRVALHLRRSPGTTLVHNWNNEEES